MALPWAFPEIRMPLPPFGMADWIAVFVPIAVSVTCTPVALPPSSIPLPRLPETMLVRIRLFPPLEVIRIPSSRFGAAPANAKIPAKVLNEMNPLALSRTSMPLRLLPEITLPSGITPPTCVLRDVPETSSPSPPLATTVALLAPTPRKLAWTIVLLELVIRRPLPPLPLSTL